MMNVIGKFHVTVKHDAETAPQVGDRVPDVTRRRHSDVRQRALSIGLDDRYAEGERLRPERKAS